jgi:hypothetical protein
MQTLSPLKGIDIVLAIERIKEKLRAEKTTAVPYFKRSILSFG